MLGGGVGGFFQALSYEGPQSQTLETPDLDKKENIGIVKINRMCNHIDHIFVENV